MGTVRALVTGQAGLNVGGSLKSFVENYTEFAQKKRNAPMLLNVEDRMEELYCQRTDKKRHKSIFMLEILKLPHSQLLQLWKEAVTAISEDIRNGPDDQDVIVYFHACFYHRETVEYFCAVNEDIIGELDPGCVITLIDDIFDIHQRLRATKQIFSRANGGAR